MVAEREPAWRRFIVEFRLSHKIDVKIFKMYPNSTFCTFPLSSRFCQLIFQTTTTTEPLFFIYFGALVVVGVCFGILGWACVVCASRDNSNENADCVRRNRACFLFRTIYCTSWLFQLWSFFMCCSTKNIELEVRRLCMHLTFFFFPWFETLFLRVTNKSSLLCSFLLTVRCGRGILSFRVELLPKTIFCSWC